MARRNRTPEENARREKIRELLQMSNIDSMDDIQKMNLFNANFRIFPYKTEKNRAFPDLPHSKTEIFCKNYKFSTLSGQKGEKIPF